MALIDIPQYRSELAEIRKSLLAAGDALHIDHIREQLDELTEEMNQPEFWNDPDHSAKVNQKVSNLKGKLEHYEKLLSSADGIEVMLEMAEEEKDEDTVTEAVDEQATLKEHTDALELETLMRGDYDDNDAVLSLHAGAGGTEAQDWTSMLYRMYTRYCERMGFTVKVLDLLEATKRALSPSPSRSAATTPMATSAAKRACTASSASPRSTQTPAATHPSRRWTSPPCWRTMIPTSKST